LEGGAAAKEMVWCGVSAGGGLALSGLTSLRDQGGPLPAACILLSPFLDLTLAGESFGALARRDLLLRPAGVERAATLYAGAGDRRAASPLFGDLRGLPPLLIITGSDEVLLSDSTRLAERAAKAGVDVTLRVFEGLFHVFPAAEFLPETREALKAVREFAGRVLDH
jgi:acetyl esterase/lipase